MKVTKFKLRGHMRVHPVITPILSVVAGVLTLVMPYYMDLILGPFLILVGVLEFIRKV